MLKRLDLLNMRLRIQSLDREALIPLRRQPAEWELRQVQESLGEMRLGMGEFLARAERPKDLVDALAGKLPPHLLASVPRSFDVIGRVAVVEIPPELQPYESIVGAVAMEIQPNVKTVLAKAGAVSRDFRLRDFRVIAGEENTLTVYKEHGCLYRLDLRKVYFSPRLSHERLRVAYQVMPNECVLDMFAGVGPYSILIARKRPQAKIYAIDLNPAAVDFLEENIMLNKVHGIVIPILGDAQDIVRERLSGVADRVIMNLPKEAAGYVSAACTALKKEGGIVHYYTFKPDGDALDCARDELKARVEGAGRALREFLTTRVVKAVAPYELQIVADARVG